MFCSINVQTFTQLLYSSFFHILSFNTTCFQFGYFQKGYYLYPEKFKDLPFCRKIFGKTIQVPKQPWNFYQQQHRYFQSFQQA